MSRVIEVIVSPKGETTVQTKGFAATACRPASSWSRRSASPPADSKTGEFYQSAAAEQHVDSSNCVIDSPAPGAIGSLRPGPFSSSTKGDP